MSEFLKSVENQSIQNEDNDIFNIKKINKKYGKFNKGFDVFEGYLDTLEVKSLKQQILQIFNSDNRRDYFKLKRYIKKNGFPNSKSIYDFKAKFGIKNLESSNKVKESSNEVKEKEVKKIYLRTYDDILPIKSDDIIFIQLKERLVGLDKGTVDISEITKYLSNLDDNQFKELLNIFKKYDEENGTELYSSFKDTLISIDSSFKSKINVFENKFDLSAKSVVNLSRARMKAVADSSLLGEDLYKGGIDATLDITKRPPERFLKNKEGYKLETPLGVRDFYQATINYEKGKQQLYVKKENAEKYYKKVSSKKTELKEKIKDLESNELIDDLELQILRDELSIVDTKINLLQEQFLDIKESYKELESKYRQDLKNEVEKYRRTIKEQDESSLKTLNFIHSIGFDMIPQNITDQIFREIKQTNYVSGIKLNPEIIDLENGTFGESISDFGEKGMLGMQGKLNLIKFLEKIIYGEIGSKNSIFAGLKPSIGFSIDNQNMLSELDKYGIMSNGGWNINVIRKNLQKLNN